MNLNVYSPSGRKTSTITLPKEVFTAKDNPALVAQAVKIYLSNQRQGSKKVKHRGEVKGTGKKIYRQKGTGRARHGDRFAPIFVGGGKAHGPTGKENYSLRLNKAMRRKSLFAALSFKAKSKQIIVVDKLETLKPKTKLIKKTIDTLLAKNDLSKEKKVAIILSQVVEPIIKSTRNLKNVKTIQANQLTTYEVLANHSLIFTKDSIKVINQTFKK